MGIDDPTQLQLIEKFIEDRFGEQQICERMVRVEEELRGLQEDLSAEKARVKTNMLRLYAICLAAVTPIVAYFVKQLF